MDLSLNCWFRCTDCSLDQRSRYCLSARTDREPEKSERIGSLRSQISIPANASDTSLDLRARFGTAWTRSGEQQAIDILSSHRSSQKSALRGRSFRALRHRRPHTSRVSPTGRALRGQTTTERAQAPHMTNPLARVSAVDNKFAIQSRHRHKNPRCSSSSSKNTHPTVLKAPSLYRSLTECWSALRMWRSLVVDWTALKFVMQGPTSYECALVGLHG
jgi:hypothetical protein